MEATISIVVNYGKSYASYSGEVAKNSFYLLAEDSGIVSPVTSPLRRPESGIAYSFEKYLRLRCDVAPNTKCSNFKVWYASGIPSGHTVKVNSDIVSSYAEPVNTESTKGTRVDFTTKNSEANSIALSGDLINIGDYTSWSVFQVALSSVAEIGSHSLDWTIQYDEV